MRGYVRSALLIACCLRCGDSFTFAGPKVAPIQPQSKEQSDATRVTTSSTLLQLHSSEAAVSLEAEFITPRINGDCSSSPFEKLDKLNMTIPDTTSSELPTAPHLSFDKFLVMQDKRVVVTIIYSGEAGLKPYFLTVAKKLKASFPDVIIERKILTAVDSDDQKGEATFEVLVDGNVVVGKVKSRKQKVARVDMAHARSVFVSMQEVDYAVSRARKRRRPASTYGVTAPRVSRREMLRDINDKSDSSEGV
jgi:hypothetical protein